MRTVLVAAIVLATAAAPLPALASSSPAPARDTLSPAVIVARLDSLQRQLDSIGREIALLRAGLDSAPSLPTLRASSRGTPSVDAAAVIRLGTRTKTSHCRMTTTGRPDSACTPGKLMTSDADLICTQSTKERRKVSAALKRDVAAAYDVTLPAPAGTIEIDHFIPLALGGDNAVENLWPEPATPKPGFHEKDLVELNLHNRVCDGEIDLEEAVRIVTTDWVKYWRQISRE
jgi:hypothetical protein